MRISWEQLKNLPTFTQSGTKLGHVSGLVINVETHEVAQYEIKPGLSFNRKVILIAVSQVISITAEKMIVEDTAIPATEAKKDKATAASSTVTTMASTREN